MKIGTFFQLKKEILCRDVNVKLPIGTEGKITEIKEGEVVFKADFNYKGMLIHTYVSDDEIEETEYVDVFGYEVPKSLSEDKVIKKVLKELRKNKVVVYRHDDGPSILYRAKFERIFGAIGVDVINRDHYSVVFLDVCKVDGAQLV